MSDSKCIYSVSITEYLDDYKARGSDWSTTDSPSLFTTQRRAELYLCEYFITYIIDHDLIEKIPDKYQKQVGEYKYEILEKYHYDFETLEKIMTDYCIKAEFVPTKLEWFISSESIDTDLTPDALLQDALEKKKKRKEISGDSVKVKNNQTPTVGVKKAKKSK